MTVLPQTLPLRPIAPSAKMTPGEKLLKRLTQYPGRVLQLTIVVGDDGQPHIVAILSETRAEVLSVT